MNNNFHNILKPKWFSDFNSCEGSEPSHGLISLNPKIDSLHVYQKNRSIKFEHVFQFSKQTN